MEKRDASDEASFATSKESETLDSVFDNVDHSLIQQPLQTGIQNILQILKCMKHGTTEVRHLILRGCNIIYECKICNSLYRSLANFLLHKRFYCKKEILESKMADDSQIVTPSSSPEHLSTLNGNHKIENDIIESNPSTDFASDTHNGIKCEHNKLSEDNSIENVVSNISLEGRASINNQIEPSSKTETMDTKDIKPSCNSANITSFYNTNSRAKRLSRRTDCNLASLMCLKCNTKYTSMKTLYFHMITIHSAKRQYYPCPYCDNSFVQMWGVTRHLTQVHNKTKKQVNRLKETVRRNAFVKREYSVSKHVTNRSRNQSYFSHNRNRYHKRNAGFSRKSSNLNGSHKKMGVNAPVKLTASSVIEKKVKGMIDAKKLVCLKCRRKFSTFSNLRRHAAIHAGWTRYMCQRCCYQSYNRSDCRTHIQRMHAYPGMHDLDKFIVSLPSVKISVTKGESLNNRPVKFKKKCKKTEGTSSNSEKENGDLFERPIKWNGFTYSDNHMESLVTRSRKYPKVQTYSNTATRLHNQQDDLNVDSKKETGVEA